MNGNVLFILAATSFEDMHVPAVHRDEVNVYGGGEAAVTLRGLPRVGIAAEETPTRTSLDEDDVANARSIDSGERLE